MKKRSMKLREEGLFLFYFQPPGSQTVSALAPPLNPLLLLPPARGTRREQTVRWAMLDQLKSPPAYFKDVLEAHFRLRGATILASVNRWVTWCKDKGHKRHSEAIKKMVPELEAALAKLTKT